METTTLFVYGKLRPTVNPPLSMLGFTDDHVLGRIFSEEGDVFVVLEPEGNKIWGYTLEIAASELEALDEYEGSEYERVQTTTGNGSLVWIYVRSESFETYEDALAYIEQEVNNETCFLDKVIIGRDVTKEFERG